ncbi:MAG: ABC transporter substrate-binding protein [bacterium]|nr:ABC transporter substrate-binding protein [bacterium]
MGKIEIGPGMTLFEITEKHPETIDAFVANGFENMGEEDKRKTQGKMVTLVQAVKAKGKDLKFFINLLENAVNENQDEQDVTLKTVDHESKVFPSEGDIRVAGLLPCPVRIPMLEAFDEVAKSITEETGLTVGARLAAASVGADVLEEGMNAIDGENDLPDLFLSAGFEAFFDKKNMARFKDRGVFVDRSWPTHNKIFDGYDMMDPDGHYAMLAVVPAVFLVDKTQLEEGEAVPQTWEEILSPRFVNKIAMPVGDFDLFNGILLTIWKYFGDEGVAAIGRNLLEGMHPSQAAGRFAPKGGKGPMVSVIPYFFSKMAQFNPDAEIVWPTDGAVISPIFMLLKESSVEPAGRLADFFASREVGEILSHRGLFPSCHPEVENNVPESCPFMWLGWDFIKENDLGELIPRVNDIFLKAGE